MSCNSHTLAGIGLGCKDAIGSIKEVYLIKDEEVTDISLDEAGSAVASITLNASATFKTYKFRKGTSSMTSTMTTDEAAGFRQISHYSSQKWRQQNVLRLWQCVWIH